MPSRKTPLVTGEIYHLFNRGVNKAPIFSDKRSYSRFLSIFNYYQYSNTPLKFSHLQALSQKRRSQIYTNLKKESLQWVDILAFCLMPNHFHFLVRQKVDNGITSFMHKASVSYGHYFNLRQERIGPLLQSAFKDVRIESGEQLLHVARYIHINPYVSFITDKNQFLKYLWSSLSSYINKKSLIFLEKETINSYFKSMKDHIEFLKNEADYKRSLRDIGHLTLE